VKSHVAVKKLGLISAMGNINSLLSHIVHSLALPNLAYDRKCARDKLAKAPVDINLAHHIGFQSFQSIAETQ
jgi:hypothetical protein